MDDMKVRIALKDQLVLVNFRDLVVIQKNLKSLTKENYEKLKGEIIKFGFSAPFYVWQKPKGMLCILDGTQRHRTLCTMADEGFEIPPVPCVMIKASNEKDAKLRLLAYASQYGKIDQDGVYEYLTENDILLEDFVSRFSLPEMVIPKFLENFYEDPSESASDDKVEGVDNLADIKITCPKSLRSEIIEHINQYFHNAAIKVK